jgi:hypothetical protein
MLTQEYVKSILDYNPETGVFLWKHRSDVTAFWNTRYSNTIAGWINGDGYREIKINTVSYLCHRLAWFYTYGKWPINDLDHRNRIRHDNRLKNLRPATNAQNQRNRSKQKNNTSGFKGVTLFKQSGKWIAHIRVNGKRIHLGLYDCKAAAWIAYQIAADIYHGEFAREK